MSKAWQGTIRFVVSAVCATLILGILVWKNAVVWEIDHDEWYRMREFLIAIALAKGGKEGLALGYKKLFANGNEEKE